MTPTDTGRLALQSLVRYPLRTAMLLLAIAIGVAAVVMLTAVGEGARRYVTGQFASLGTNLLIVFPGKAETSGTGIQGMLVGEAARDLTLGDTLAIARSRHVGEVAPIVVGSGTASWGARHRDITVLGTTAPLLEMQHWALGSGRFLPAIGMEVAAPVCVLGHVVARELFAGGPPLGEWVRLGDTRCRVIGTLAQGGMAGGFDRDELVVLPVASAQQLFNAPGVFRVLVEARNREAMPLARAEIIEIVKARHAGEEDITVVTQDAVLDTFDSIFGMITLGLAGIAAVSLIVAGVLIMNVMLVAVSQRTAEIGLLKAIGAKRRQIIALFLTEAGCVSLLGAGAGVALGALGNLALRTAFPALDFEAPRWAAVAALGIAVAAGLAFGILPARRAAGLDPVNALLRR